MYDTPMDQVQLNNQRRHNNQLNNHNQNQQIRDFLQQYIDVGYTEEMYREHTEEIFEVIRNTYQIESPTVLANRLNSYRAVLVTYANNVPLFELEAFGF
jgi:hypothetical protein